jgi:hypothetical protein
MEDLFRLHRGQGPVLDLKPNEELSHCWKKWGSKKSDPVFAGVKLPNRLRSSS